jgi:23S rRNA (guanosine2251-2'-O)-methyltransferase
MNDAYLILHNVRSAQNVGAIFRTADAVGIAKIYLTGYTPHPLDRFGRKRTDVAKAALGAEQTVPWEVRTDPGKLLQQLKKHGTYLVAIEQSTAAVDYRTIRPTFPVAFILGNEVRGLSPSVLKRCDIVAQIPQVGVKESLNVSVAAGVFLFRVLDPSR